MPERRYSRYKQSEVWATLYQQQAALGVQVLDGTVLGNSVSLLYAGTQHRAVILARSHDWYVYSLNCVERWKHDITCIVCCTHDSCVEVPVLALDTLRWYEPKTTRIKGDDLAPKKLDAKGRPADSFEARRVTEYGHHIFVGALLCGRADAIKRLEALPKQTRWRIEAKVKRLHLRRSGRPLKVSEYQREERPS